MVLPPGVRHYVVQLVFDLVHGLAHVGHVIAELLLLGGAGACGLEVNLLAMLERADSAVLVFYA